MKCDIETTVGNRYTELYNSKFLGGCCAIPDPNPNAGYYIGALMICIMMLRVFGYVY